MVVLSHRVDARLVLEHVEAHGFGKGSALSDGDDVSLLHVLPAGRAVHRHVFVALLETSPERSTSATGRGAEFFAKRSEIKIL